MAGLLAHEPGFRVVAEVADGDDAVRAAREHRAALVLTDVRMPGGGPDLVRRLVALPHRPVVAGLSAQADPATWTRVLAAGGSAYLLKGTLAGDVQRIRSWPYLPAGLPVLGCVYDVRTGRLEVTSPEATAG